MGKVYLVGAGPGDPGLLTLNGYETIKNADCLIYDRLVGDEIIHIAKPECELIYVGKENHRHTLPQEKINELLYNKALEYEHVVRLKGGDPYVFGRGGEEALYLLGKGIPVDVVPGISSSIAALSYAGIPITHRGISTNFHVFTAHGRKDEMIEIDYSALLDESCTAVFLMGLSHVGKISKRFLEAGRKAQTPVAVISNGTLPNQKTCVGNLLTIEEKVKEAGLTSPAIIVVGNTVNLAENLAFFENRPLFGKRYFVPYIEGFDFTFANGLTVIRDSRLATMIKKQGGDVIPYKVGKIRPLPIDFSFLKEMREDDYLVFTSQNGVAACMSELKRQGLSIRNLKGKIAVVGKKTAKAIESFGLSIDVMPEKQLGACLGKELAGRIENPSTKVIWLAAKKYSKGLEEELAGRCDLIILPAYENQEVDEAFDQLEVDGVIYTSASNARRCIKHAQGKLEGVPVYSIGAVCSREIKRFGCMNFEEAKEPSYEAIVELLAK